MQTLRKKINKHNNTVKNKHTFVKHSYRTRDGYVKKNHPRSEDFSSGTTKIIKFSFRNRFRNNLIDFEFGTEDEIKNK